MTARLTKQSTVVVVTKEHSQVIEVTDDQGTWVREVLNDDAPDEAGNRLRTEFSTAQELRHDCIVQAHRFDPNGRFAEWEFVAPMCLADWVKGRPSRINSVRAYEMIVQLCGALEFAHERFVAHGALEPRDIFYDERTGRLKVGGFARRLDSEASVEDDVRAVGRILLLLLTGTLLRQDETWSGPLSDRPASFMSTISRCLSDDCPKSVAEIPNMLADVIEDLSPDDDDRTTKGKEHPHRRVCAGRFELMRELKDRVWIAEKTEADRTACVLKFKKIRADAEREVRLGAEFALIGGEYFAKPAGPWQDRDGTFAVETELFEGVLLTKWRRDANRFDKTYFLDIAESLCEAIYKVHAVGLCHRDLTPSNILIRREPVRSGKFKIRIVDFDAAAKIGTRLGAAEFEAAAAPRRCSVGFSSPEMVRDYQQSTAEDYSGQARLTDDYYSLGAVCYYLITGEKWYGCYGEIELGPVASVKHRISQALTRLGLGEQVPEHIVDAVARCLSGSPRERLAPRDLFEALETEKAGAPVRSLTWSAILFAAVSGIALLLVSLPKIRFEGFEGFEGRRDTLEQVVAAAPDPTVPTVPANREESIESAGSISRPTPREDHVPSLAATPAEVRIPSYSKRIERCEFVPVAVGESLEFPEELRDVSRSTRVVTVPVGTYLMRYHRNGWSPVESRQFEVLPGKYIEVPIPSADVFSNCKVEFACDQPGTRISILSSGRPLGAPGQVNDMGEFICRLAPGTYEVVYRYESESYRTPPVRIDAELERVPFRWEFGTVETHGDFVSGLELRDASGARLADFGSAGEAPFRKKLRTGSHKWEAFHPEIGSRLIEFDVRRGETTLIEIPPVSRLTLKPSREYQDLRMTVNGKTAGSSALKLWRRDPVEVIAKATYFEPFQAELELDREEHTLPLRLKRAKGQLRIVAGQKGASFVLRRVDRPGDSVQTQPVERLGPSTRCGQILETELLDQGVWRIVGSLDGWPEKEDRTVSLETSQQEISFDWRTGWVVCSPNLEGTELMIEPAGQPAAGQPLTLAEPQKFRLKEGEYSYRAVYGDLQPEEGRFTVAKNETVNLDLNLSYRRIAFVLDPEAEPDVNVTVLCQGKRYRMSEFPIVLPPCRPGAEIPELTVVEPCFHHLVFHEPRTDGDTTIVPVGVERKCGSIRVDGIPAQTEIVIRGHDGRESVRRQDGFGSLHSDSFELPFTVCLKHADYLDWSKTVDRQQITASYDAKRDGYRYCLNRLPQGAQIWILRPEGDLERTWIPGLEPPAAVIEKLGVPDAADIGVTADMAKGPFSAEGSARVTGWIAAPRLHVRLRSPGYRNLDLTMEGELGAITSMKAPVLVPSNLWANQIGMVFSRVTMPDGGALLASVTETTEGDYYRVLTGEDRQGDEPVRNVSLNEARDFVRKLSDLDGLAYRLPTVEEWRAFSGRYRYPWGDEPPYGAENLGPKLDCDSFEFHAPVAQGIANVNRLFDLGGNVAEWTTKKGRAHRMGESYKCDDWSHLNLRCDRGYPSSWDKKEPTVGFRVVLPIQTD